MEIKVLDYLIRLKKEKKVKQTRYTKTIHSYLFGESNKNGVPVLSFS